MRFSTKFALLGIAAITGITGITALAAPGDMFGNGTGTADAGLTELLTRASAVREQCHADAQHVLHLQQLARKQKDIVRLNCVNDKLVQIKPQLNMLERAESDLQASFNHESRHTAFNELNLIGENVRRLREEADGCAGEPILSSESSNTWTHPLIPDDPYSNPFQPGIEPPGYASPFN
jgi:hypothetical protein